MKEGFAGEWENGTFDGLEGGRFEGLQGATFDGQENAMGLLS